MASRMQSLPRWTNPCGEGSVGAPNGAAVSVPISDDELLTTIVHQSIIAKNKAEAFKSKFVEKVFNTKNVSEIEERFKDQDYDWLPTKDIPKKLGQSIVDPSHLQSLELDSTLLKTYTQLQRIAVGLEQIVWDQEDEMGPFRASFVEAEGLLRSVLCEVQTAIIEHNLSGQPDITRDIMDEQFRTMDNTSSHIRNWVIYRDYMNMLEYVIEVFTYFRQNVR